jgi:hypothetical protein
MKKNATKLLKLTFGLAILMGTAIFVPAHETSAGGFPCDTCKGGSYYCGGYVGGPCGVKKMDIHYN